MVKLTKTFADEVRPPETGYAIHWDDKVPGYGLRVTASGVRSFVAQGRVQGKAVIVTIGRYGLYTEDKARKRAQSVLQDMREGIDPRDAKKADEAMRVTLGDPLWLPLSSQAVELLKSRPRRKLDDGKESPFVFPSWSKTGHITDARAPMELVSEVVGKHLSLHDLRRTFSNIAMRECLIEKFRTDLLTGHKPAQEDVTARNYLDLARLDWLQPEVQRIADWIEAQAKVSAAKAAGANVVLIRA